MKPLEPRAFVLAVAVFLTAISPERVLAQTLERQCPPTGAETIFARPVFAWTYGTENLLTNPGFEDGTNGWAISPGGVVMTSPPNGAAEGTNAFRVSVGRISREVSLPAVDTGLSLSYALRGLYQLAGPEMVEIEPVGGAEPPVNLPIPGFTSNGRWVIHTADLSAYRGQTVRLTWKFPSADGVPWYLDDVRITPVAPDTQFEIWWRRNRAAELELLARTALPSVAFPELLPNVRHDWRVDVVRNGVTNVGPVWTFTTASAFGAETLTGAPLPTVVCPDQSLPVAIRVTDERGFPARNTPVTFILAASGPDVNPPGVLITEVDTGVPDGVEFQNVSDDAIDLSGWQVELFRTVDTTAGGKVTIPAGSVLAPGNRFTIADNRPPSSPWPSLGVPVQLDWDERAPLSAGVVL
ncbi:MAG TPA: hypothetical protein PLX89_21550, partial [Verrucomicrobiota bacterium]|nr:hypothetical protein [Verrucomicrobiales bacterium]HRI15590.1 hypothetical protein [Verrucomicrobiota bacterium]